MILNGRVYGTTVSGGPDGSGTIFNTDLMLPLASPVITSPANNATVDYATNVTLQGTLSPDSYIVTNVYYSLNGGAWTTATTTNDWNNFSADATPLLVGTNTIASYAVAEDGTVSATNISEFSLLPPPPVVYTDDSPLTNTLTDGASGIVFTSTNNTQVVGAAPDNTLLLGPGGITGAPGSGGGTIGGTNADDALNVALDGSQTWTNNGDGPITLVNTVSNGTPDPATLTLVGDEWI